MKRPRRWTARSPMRASELFADDGLRADEIFQGDHHSKSNRKTQQLCRQVERIVSLALSDCGDPLLRELTVEGVSPARDASRLLVSLRLAASSAAGNQIDPSRTQGPEALAQMLERLDRVRGRLRREVAEAITRKRAPELLFRLLPPAGGEVQP